MDHIPYLIPALAWPILLIAARAACKDLAAQLDRHATAGAAQ